MFELDRFSVSFDGATALREATLTIRPGERLGIVGESGSGKTMLALSLMGMAPEAAAISGRLLIDGRDMAGSSEADWQRLGRGRSR